MQKTVDNQGTIDTDIVQLTTSNVSSKQSTTACEQCCPPTGRPEPVCTPGTKQHGVFSQKKQEQGNIDTDIVQLTTSKNVSSKQSTTACEQCCPPTGRPEPVCTPGTKQHGVFSQKKPEQVQSVGNSNSSLDKK